MSRPYFLKADRPTSLRDVPNWLTYHLLNVLARQSWLISERRAYKFRRSANKRSARSNGHSVNEIDTHPIGFRAEILINLQPLDKNLADWPHRRPKRQPVDLSGFRNALKVALRQSGGTGVLALSHDNYRNVPGGIQLCLLIEEAAFKGRDIAYIHLCPAQPLPIMAPKSAQLNFDFEITINGVWLGHISAADIFAGLDAERHQGGRFCMAVHSLLGHSPEITAELYRCCDAREAFFWLHDYFSLCANYTLMRNDVSTCSAPSVEAAGCRICHAGDHRIEHLKQLKLLFSQVPFTVVAPSDFTLRLWRGATDLTYCNALVHEHCEIRQNVDPIEMSPPVPSGGNASPLNVAYLGAPVFHKGWTLFAEIVRDLNGSFDFNFHHLGKSKSKDYPPNLAFTPITVSPEDWYAMSNAVRTKKIDVAVLCSLWPETYNFTAVEALAGGALIVTLESSGNIPAIVRAHNCGVVFKTETDLRRAFADGSLAREVRNRMQGPPARYQITHRGMTADLFLVGAS
jgi:glycosyltransferase involved in cell wall biosynthesis